MLHRSGNIDDIVFHWGKVGWERVSLFTGLDWTIELEIGNF